MIIPSWLAWTIAALAALGIIWIVVREWRRGRRAQRNLDALFTVVFVPFLGRIRGAIQPGATSTLLQLEQAVNAAIQALRAYGPWAEADLIRVLHNVRIFVRNRDRWTDLWGREVAGVALIGTDPSTTVVEVGNNLEALCHELAEVLYAHLNKGTGAWHEANWAGRASVGKACAEYLRLLHEQDTGTAGRTS